ncbi:hypothetical protein CCAN2_1740004 [Capnocytophaga canimorsus]|nr:hypothetical protein CCAN2_1740004 [Capnocytophaga canimorsus]
MVKKKAEPFKNTLTPTDILITSDTIVWCEDKALGKPQSHNEAKAILSLLSDKQHEVITSVGLNHFRPTNGSDRYHQSNTKKTLRCRNQLLYRKIYALRQSWSLWHTRLDRLGRGYKYSGFVQ